MSNYGSGLIGLDVKPRRKVARRNRYRTTLNRWLFPAIFALALTLGLFVVIGTR